TCGSTAMADPNDGGTTIFNTMNCDFNGGNDAGEECLDSSGKPVDQPGVAFTSPAITNTRFYSVKLFDPPGYVNRPRMVEGAAQTTYNQHTLTDMDLTNVGADAGMATDAGGWFPQQPTPVVSLNAKTGQAGYSGVSLEPGAIIPIQILVGAAAVQGDVSWLDVPRNLHNCRHPSDGGTAICTN